MRKAIQLLIIHAVIFLVLISCKQKSIYRNNGVFEGRSQSYYTNEPFVGFTKVIIENGRISEIDFEILDTLNKELFDGEYERHFIGNDEYINQCRNDWKGVQTYPQNLVEMQKMEYVDAISGATWSYNIFKSSIEIALRKATQ